MKITVVGTGNMATSFVKQLTKNGHLVQIVGRNAEKSDALAKKYGAKVISPLHGSEADIIILATAYAEAVSALRSLGNLSGKLVVDITNPVTADYMALTIGHNTSAAEEISQAFPGVKLVKAFNTIFAQVLAEGPKLAGSNIPVFIATDDETAKGTVSLLVNSLGFDVIDAGGLKNARYLEPLGGLNIYLGYGAGLGTSIAPSWLFAK
ncbi:NADPH-dependent F420 reductase [Kluyvera intermedia]|uniref:NADPH-dependent F420 reductase n=1 Tax=Kluyvera intermedia TaxID=61648 RepID=A0ABX3UCM8_KLUIN|nr:NADPH-dependent F420 reductase [Kluyvera intermedia]ORJ48933.1 NADPH-dependent F420 reductase [Kluyvera intermedia]